MNAAPLLSVEGLVKRFAGFVALSEIRLAVAPGERLGLIGPNGSGKTTLINCVSGLLRPEQGIILYDGQAITRMPAFERTRLGIARSFQIPRPFRSMSVLENLMVPLDYVAHRGQLRDTGAEDEAMDLLAQMGLAEKAQAFAGSLTQVDLRKLELARALAARPKLLISDEAMAGLSGAEVEEVLALLWRLNETGITVIMIEHIMSAVMRFSQRVICLDAGKIIAEGTPTQMVENPEVRRAYLGA
ncbi:MAG: ABC transporter ATP-binding protein [Rhodospirillales bacterium]|nr:ABC transporter ATP-binding protein [Rhodospirillales bacterium]